MKATKRYDENFDIVTYNDELYLKILKGDAGGNETGTVFKHHAADGTITRDIEVTVKNLKADCEISIEVDIETIISDDKEGVYARII